MKIQRITLLLFLALILSFMDVSFFASIQISGASVISSYALIIIFALLQDAEKKLNESILFESACLIFFSIFSSVSVLILFILFFIVPGIIIFLRKNYFSLPSVFVSLFFFIAANLIFESALLLYYREWNVSGFNALGYFILMNSCFGVFIYAIIMYLRRKKLTINI